MSILNNTNKLQELLNKANSLPEASAGGGSASVKTCSVTIINLNTTDNAQNAEVAYSYQNELVYTDTVTGSSGITIECSVNSLLLLTAAAGVGVFETIGEIEEIFNYGSHSLVRILGSGTINIYVNSGNFGGQ